MTGTVLGTAGYFSPEQAQGDRASSASDRYALAIVAWELLTGGRPYESESATAEAAAHVSAPIPAISAAGDFRPELDRVFEQALAKDPADRYATAGEFVAAVAAAADRERSLRGSSRIAERPRRHRPAVAYRVGRILCKAPARRRDRAQAGNRQPQRSPESAR